MLHCYPYVPVGGEMAMNCAILTYNGTAYFGFSGDVHAAPDLRRLEALLQLSFTELRKAAGIVPPRKHETKKEPKRGAKKEQVKVRTGAKVAKTKTTTKTRSKVLTPPVTAPAPASVLLRPSTSVEAPIAPGPPLPLKEEVLTRLSA
jgi:hypothetical protein